MAIAKSLADKMGGDIRVTSEKGKGSVFVVTLAFEIAEEKRSEETSAAADIAGLRLLLAEDNELNAEIAERLLSDEARASPWFGMDRKRWRPSGINRRGRLTPF
ncbi:MAG: hypothetical protein ACLR07_06310 [Christensenellales bacterium]